MAKGKPTPEKSKIERDRPLAYSRRQKGGGGDDDAPSAEPAKTEGANPPEAAKTDAPKAEAAKTESGKTAAAKTDAPKAEAAKTEAAKTEAAKAEAPKAEAKPDVPPEIEPPPPKGEPWPDATPQPMRPVEPARARTVTGAMPAELGAPPAMPANPGAVEDPTLMPNPRDIPAGNPGDPASPPGRVPSGDSRSLRKDNEFALIYRVQTAVISRFGVVGTRGQWRVVDYPTSSSASNAYAKEVSRFVAEGFSDYRD